MSVWFVHVCVSEFVTVFGVTFMFCGVVKTPMYFANNGNAFLRVGVAVSVGGAVAGAVASEASASRTEMGHRVKCSRVLPSGISRADADTSATSIGS